MIKKKRVILEFDRKVVEHNSMIRISLSDDVWFLCEKNISTQIENYVKGKNVRKKVLVKYQLRYYIFYYIEKTTKKILYIIKKND